jgi:thioester reductase-like protein
LGVPVRDFDYVEYTFADLQSFSRRLARIYSKSLPLRTTSTEDARVVALLGPSTLDYVMTALALTRLGFTVLFLSTRLSTSAYRSLLEATGCRHMVVHPSFHKVASTLLLQASSSSAAGEELTLIDMRPQDEYLGVAAAAAEIHETREREDPLDPDEETTKVCWIIHSSGSTGPPKPIYQTHRSALRNYEQNMDMRGFVTLPLYHAHGLSSVFRAVTAVKKIFMWNADRPLTRTGLLAVLDRHAVDIFYGVPYALKLLSETREGVAALAALKVVMFGGSACPDPLGDRLTERGVNLVSHYGTTETGQLMTSSRPPGDRAWNYVRMHDALKPYVRWEERGGHLYELVVLPGWPSKVATNRDDGSYATKDLFEPHPSIPGAWKYCARLDDTIVLVNGEKAIPIDMEQALRQDRLVQEAVMFGAGKSQLGMIVVASSLAASVMPDKLLDALWPAITAQNEKLPAYAQLAKEMVRVLPAGTEYPSTDKGTMIRQAFYRAFEKEIDEIYQQAESRSAGVLVLSEPELRDFLRKQVLELTAQEDSSSVRDTTDLFSLGVDSLQSTRLRAKILKEIQLHGNPLPPNVVFEYPTIAKLAAAILSIRDRKAAAAADVVQEMQGLVAKYSNFPRHVPTPPTSDQTCVVVTGATGSLGAHLVAQLVLRDDVSEVCCLVRAGSGASARQRVFQSLRERALYDGLSAEHHRKITCHASDFSKPLLGLDESLYQKLAGKITCTVHCAWSVNFNKSLASFEADCIAGARNLMLLCLSARRPTPASFNFCSSVSAVANAPFGELVPEAVLDDSFRRCQAMGYAQSKLVAEHLTGHAAAQTGMQARVLRVGQIIADTKHGIWNDTEAVPLMLRSAITVGALPTLDEAARWLPVDTVASAMLDIALSNNAQTVFNVVNPRSFHWTADLLPVLRAAGLSFEEVDQTEWIRRLRASDANPEVNPTIKLVEFFAHKYDDSGKTGRKRRGLDYVTTAAETASPALRNVPALTTEAVKKFVDRFLETSWAPKSKDTWPIR